MAFVSPYKPMTIKVLDKINLQLLDKNLVIEIDEHRPRKMFGEKKPSYTINLYRIDRDPEKEDNIYYLGYYDTWKECWIALVNLKCGLNNDVWIGLGLQDFGV